MFTARIVRLQDGWLVGERGFDTPELAAEHLFMLLTLAKWRGDRDETLGTLVDGSPVVWKGMAYRVVRPTAITELLDEVRKAGDIE